MEKQYAQWSRSWALVFVKTWERIQVYLVTATAHVIGCRED